MGVCKVVVECLNMGYIIVGAVVCLLLCVPYVFII